MVLGNIPANDCRDLHVEDALVWHTSGSGTYILSLKAALFPHSSTRDLGLTGSHRPPRAPNPRWSPGCAMSWVPWRAGIFRGCSQWWDNACGWWRNNHWNTRKRYFLPWFTGFQIQLSPENPTFSHDLQASKSNYHQKTVVKVPLCIGFQRVSSILLVVQNFPNLGWAFSDFWVMQHVLKPRTNHTHTHTYEKI